MVVAAVALVAGCGSGGTTVGTTSVPDPGARDGGVAGGGDGGGSGGMPGGGPSGGGGSGGMPGGGSGGTGGGGTGGVGGGGGSGGSGGGGTTACPRTPTSITGHVQPGIFTVDDNDVYAFTLAALDAYPVGGGTAGVVVDDIDTGRDRDLDSNFTTLFWLVVASGGDSAKIVSVPKTGSTPTVLADSPTLTNLFVDGFKIFYVDHGTLWTSNYDGSNRTRVTDGANAYQFAFDDTYVYWANGGLLQRAPKLGGDAQVVLTWNGGAVATFISVGPSYIFIGDGTNLRRIDKHTFAMVTTAMTAGPSSSPLWVTAVAADGDNVWFGGDTGPNQLFFGRLDPTGHVTWIDDIDPSRIIVHGDSVYYHAIVNGAPAVKRVCR